MTTQTYYSPFYPPVEDAGASGTTIAVVPSQVVTEINTQIGDLNTAVDELKANTGTGGDVTPPATVTGLALTSAIVFDTDGSQVVVLSATWNSSAESDLGYYVIALQEQGGGFVEFIVKGTSYNWQVRANRTFTAKVRAIDKFNNAGSYSSTVTINSARDLVAPALPTAFTISASLSTFFLAFTPPADVDLDVIEIWANSTNVLGTATKISEVKGGSATIGSDMNTTKYFWLRSRDTSGNLSGFTASVGATTGTVSSGTIDTTPPGNTATPNALTSSIFTQPDGTQIVRLTGTWTANTDSDLSSYEVELEEAGSSLGIYNTATNAIYLQVRGGVSYRIRIRALDRVNNRSSWSAWTAAHVAIRDQGAPGVAFSLTVTPSFSAFRLVWQNPADIDLYQIEIWQSPTASFDNAVKIDSILAIPNSVGAYTVTGVAPNVTRKYWLRTVDTSGNVGSYSGGVAASTPQIGTTDITPGGITTPLITVGTLNGDRISTGTLRAEALTVTGNTTADRLPAGIFVGTSGTTIGVVQELASDPAARINVVGTTIDPGRILISGGIKLSDWRNGSDLTKIEGGNIAANTISANKLTIGNRAVNATNLNFQTNPATNVVSWTLGSIYYTDDTGMPTVRDIAAGSGYCAPGNYLYIYWVKDSNTLSSSIVYQNALASNVVHLATYQSGAVLTVNTGGTIIDGSRITTGSIDAIQIKANAIQTYHISTGSLNADRIQAGTLTGDRFNTGTSLPGTITIGTTGVSIGTTLDYANNPVGRINAQSTQIDPGRILISGATSLASWRNGGDNTKIEGGNIAANTISANKLKIGSRALNVQDFTFQANPATNVVSWTNGVIGYIDDDGTSALAFVNAGSAQFTNTYLYIYWTKGSNTLSVGGIIDAIVDNNVPMAIYQGGSYLIVNYGGTIIDGDRITTNSILASKLNVTNLGAITANIGSLVSYNGQGGRVERDGNGSRIYDNNGTLRVRWGFW